MKRLEVNTGDRYGRLTIVKEEPFKRAPSGQVLRIFKLKCDCGNQVIINLSALRRGNSKSCGCFFKELHTFHGHSIKHKTFTYNSWSCMIQRCTNPNATGYQNYGGRGITVCERWRNFKNFLEDMGERPLGTSLDRIDPNGNYELNNCRWATPSQQNNNQRPRRKRGHKTN